MEINGVITDLGMVVSQSALLRISLRRLIAQSIFTQILGSCDRFPVDLVTYRASEVQLKSSTDFQNPVHDIPNTYPCVGVYLVCHSFKPSV